MSVPALRLVSCAGSSKWPGRSVAIADILGIVSGIGVLRIATLAAVACAAGERADGQAAGHETAAKAVQLSVVAVDNHGQPVGDLTAADFEIADAGKPEKIAIFRHSESVLQQAAPLAPGEFSNRAAANVPHATLVLFDLLNLNFSARSEAGSYLVEGLKSLESSDGLYLYLLTAEGKLVPVHPLPGAEDTAPASGGVPWTKDAKTLVEGALSKAFQLRPTFVDIGMRVRATYAALQSTASLMAGIPGRKDIVWVTRGVPISLPATVTINHEPLDFAPILRKLCLMLDRVNVAVYPVMQIPPGMGGQGADEAEFGGVSSEETLQQFAELTGGSTKSTNPIGTVVRQAMSDVRTSYQLGYYPPAENWDGKFHKLRVTCTRKGVRVQAKTGYYALPEQASDEQEALDAAVGPAYDASEIGLRCTMSPSAKGGGVMHFTLRIDPANVRIAQQGDRYTGRLDLQMVGYLSSGAPQRSAIAPLNLSWSAQELEQARKDGLVWNQDISVGTAAEKVRFLVFDRNSHAIGTLTIPLKPAK